MATAESCKQALLLQTCSTGDVAEDSLPTMLSTHKNPQDFTQSQCALLSASNADGRWRACGVLVSAVDICEVDRNGLCEVGQGEGCEGCCQRCAGLHMA